MLRDGVDDRRGSGPRRESTAMARLLVLACSATKRPDPDCIPAIARYDGPLWRTLRATDPEGRAAKVAFLSARYGFRDAATRIVDYDAGLTQDLADRMIAGGVLTRCGNLAAAPPPSTPKGGGFVTIWQGGCFVWEGSEEAIPARFLQWDLDL